MPKTKKSVKAVRKHEMIDTKTEDLLPPPSGECENCTCKRTPKSVWVVIGLLVVTVLVYLGTKGYLVAALVDGKPIFGWNVNALVMSRFGAQTLESIISEHLVNNAAGKAGVAVTKEEVAGKIDELVKTLGPNVKLEELLQYQGMNKSEFEGQVKLQLTVEKLLGKDVAVTDSEVSEYLLTNKDTLVATDEAGLRKEAQAALLSQKISEKIQPWFAQLKEKASVVRLLK
jgi:parvulin-like peptidyl-prolyl isomerase